MVDANEFLVVVQRHGQQQIELHATVDRRIVHQIVDAAESTDGAVDHGFSGILVGHVNGHMNRSTAVGDNLLGYRRGTVGVDVSDDHRGTFAGQRLSVGLPDTLGSPGDDSHLAVEHGFLSALSTR